MDKLAKIEENQGVIALKAPQTMKQFETMLGSRAQHFIVSITAMLTENDRLQKCTPQSIVTCAMKGAALDLSFDRALAECCMMPRGNQAVFVPEYRGLIQLALRTGQYVKLNTVMVTRGMFKTLREILDTSQDPERDVINFFGKIDFYPELQSGPIVGFCAYFELVNGFRKFLYWDRAKCIQHAKDHSPSYNKDTGKFYDKSAWVTNEDAMCLKSPLRELIRKYGPKSKELRGVLEGFAEDDRVIQATPDRIVGAIGSGREGYEDDDLYGEDPDSELAQAKTNVNKLWERWRVNNFERSASFKKFCRENGREEMTLNQCQDVDFIRAYGSYKQESLKEKTVKKAEKAENQPTPEPTIEDIKYDREWLVENLLSMVSAAKVNNILAKYDEAAERQDWKGRLTILKEWQDEKLKQVEDD